MRKIITAMIIVSTALAPLAVNAQSFVVSTIAGDGTNGFSGDGGPATAAKLFNPADVALDAAGNVYIADYRNHRIRKIDAATGIISTIAGNGASAYYGDGGPASASYLNYPTEIKLDAAGNIYINDGLNHRIRKIAAATGIINTIIGGGTHPYSDGMTGTDWNSTFAPAGMNVDAAGNCYFMDTDHEARILKWDVATGIVHAIIDTAGIQGYGGDGSLAVNALMDNLNYYPGISMAVDASDNIYITDIHNFRIRKADQSTGIITTVSGNGSSATSGDGGPASAASFNLPYRLAIDNAGNLYFFSNAQIHKIDGGTHIITTIAGGGSSYADGIPATSARLYDPWGIAVDASRNIYYADNNGRIRKFTPACTGATPGVIISSHALCSGDTAILTLSGATTGADVSYLWQYSTDGITWLNTGTNATSCNTGALSAVTYFRAAVTCNSAGATGATSIDTINITPVPAAGTITGSDSVCMGSTIMLSDMVSGGAWSSSNTGVAAITIGGVVTGITGGSATIYYVVSNTCGADTALQTVYVRTAGDICNTAVAPRQSQNELKVYPNPNDGTFYVNVASDIDEPVRITLTNITGEQVVSFRTVTNKETRIRDIPAAGMYFVYITTAGRQYKTRILVTR